MESEEDANMDDLLFQTFSALEANGVDSGQEEEDEEVEEEEEEEEEEELEVEVEELGGEDEEEFLAEVEGVEEDIERVRELVGKLQEGEDGDDIAAEVEEAGKSVEVGLGELAGVEGSGSAVGKLRGRFGEVMDRFQALKGRIAEENVGRRSEDSLKRRRVDVAEEPTVPAEMGAGKMCPPHPGYMFDICFRCGAEKSTIPNNEPAQDRVGLRYIHERLEVSELEASRVRNAELRRVTGKQKLLLVVDLDHTMLNSARFTEVPLEERTYLSTAYHGSNSNNINGACVGQQQGNMSSLHQLTSLGMWTKLRPFAHRFLEEASKLYEMYVYTMGERAYAWAMAKLLDPTGQLFGDRIISQTDSTKRHTKDLDVVLGSESAVVILDDTEAVWPNHRSNLILMERYHFFTSSCNQFRLRTPSLAQLHRDESEIDGTLANTLRTLKEIHHEFFNGQRGKIMKRRPLQESPDVREVIRSIRAKLLADCSIVFSRVFPTGVKHPEFHPLWQLAVELGARCRTSCDRSTTHVVALDRGTDKARWAKQHGIFLVHPRWVEAASYQWCRPHEGDYPVSDGSSAQTVTTFSRNILVEPVVIEIRSNAGDDPLGEVVSGSAEVAPVVAPVIAPVVDLGSDKSEAGPLLEMKSDKENIASTAENPNQDSGLSSPDSAGEDILITSGLEI
ncbi:hypothetical protein M758_7G144200 [Ceratodon purpureus]|nr:hypothetical protein M758_7G144200 [Ceratodon purpureus]